MNTDQYLDYIREKCEEDFEFFARYFFKSMTGGKFKFSSHHKKICGTLMKVFKGEITYLIVNMPPRYSKTELIVKLFSAWGMMKNPSSEFMHLSYSDALAMDNSNTIKEIIKSVEFQQLWPHIKIKMKKDSKKDWGTTRNGVFYATAAGGSVTGFGAGKIDEEHLDGSYKFCGALIIDDPLKPDDAYSEAKRTAVNRRWDETIKSRRNNDKTTPVIVVMQRLHEDDFCAMLLEDEEFDWTQLVLPALMNEDEDDEQALWEDKHSVDRLKVMKQKNPYMFSAQMQQSPSPLGGGIFKDQFWQYYDVLPLDIRSMVIYCDTAQKAKEHNDYTVFQCWARAFNGIYLIDQLRGKWEAPEIETNFIAFWNKHKPTMFKPMGARCVKVEDKSSGSSLIQNIQRHHTIPIEAIQRNVDKVTRAMGGVPHIAAGNVFLPRDAEWLSDYLDEFRKFTPMMTHKNDDQIDPTLDAIEDLIIFEESLYTAGALS